MFLRDGPAGDNVLGGAWAKGRAVRAEEQAKVQRRRGGAGAMEEEQLCGHLLHVRPRSSYEVPPLPRAARRIKVRSPRLYKGGSLSAQGHQGSDDHHTSTHRGAVPPFAQQASPCRHVQSHDVQRLGWSRLASWLRVRRGREGQISHA
eukprot:5269355-Pleurochrysis_carterae.AAC.1